MTKNDVHNEAVKLIANYLNGMAISVFAAAIIVPGLTNHATPNFGSLALLGLVLSLAVHGLAWLILTFGLRPS